MIDVSVKGHPKRVSKAIIKKAAEFFADKLMYPRLHNNISVEVEFSTAHLNKDENGWCQVYYDESSQKARTFDIGIHPALTKRQTLETLAHEMIHLRQYAQNKLYEYEHKDKDRFYRWNHDVIDVTKMWMWFLPWEIECNGMEHGLYQLFMKNQKAIEEKNTKQLKIIRKISARKTYYGHKRYQNPRI